MGSSLSPGRTRGRSPESTDEWHLDDLLRVEGPRLLAFFVRRITPADDAADLLSETFVVAWRRRDSIPAAEVEARMWLFGVARKILATHRRGALRRTALADRLREELTVSETAAALDGSRVGESLDSRVESVQEALAALRPDQREVVILVHWDGFSLVEAAALLHQRPATVRSRYHRARLALKAALG